MLMLSEIRGPGHPRARGPKTSAACSYQPVNYYSKYLFFLSYCNTNSISNILL